MPHALEKFEKLFIGEQIKKARAKIGMTQKELAKKLNTSQSVIARIEIGKQNLTIGRLVLIAQALRKKLYIRLQ
mgnify:CR=1 FL=1